MRSRAVSVKSFDQIMAIVAKILWSLTFMWPCIVNVFYKYNQQDATLCNIIYCCQCSTCFRRFLRPSSGAQNCTHSVGYMSSLLAATASVGEFQLTHSSVASGISQACLLLPLAWVSSNSPTLAVAASKLDIYPMLCVQFWASDDGRRSRLKHWQ
jgi:hypothetical protein